MIFSRNRIVWTAGLILVAGHAGGEQQTRVKPLPELDRNMKTGPAVGNRIPLFEVIDHLGRKQTFQSLRGEKGLVLLFIRSADW